MYVCMYVCILKSGSARKISEHMYVCIMNVRVFRYMACMYVSRCENVKFMYVIVFIFLCMYTCITYIHREMSSIQPSSRHHV
jgi:hypothetical protein